MTCGPHLPSLVRLWRFARMAPIAGVPWRPSLLALLQPLVPTMLRVVARARTGSAGQVGLEPPDVARPGCFHRHRVLRPITADRSDRHQSALAASSGRMEAPAGDA